MGLFSCYIVDPGRSLPVKPKVYLGVIVVLGDHLHQQRNDEDLVLSRFVAV